MTKAYYTILHLPLCYPMMIEELKTTLINIFHWSVKTFLLYVFEQIGLASFSFLIIVYHLSSCFFASGKNCLWWITWLLTFKLFTYLSLTTFLRLFAIKKNTSCTNNTIPRNNQLNCERILLLQHCITRDCGDWEIYIILVNFITHLSHSELFFSFHIKYFSISGY